MSITAFLYRVNEYILNPLIILMFALALVYFLYGVVDFLRREPGDKDRETAWKAILWGIVGMVIMFSVFGLVRFVMATFGITPNNPSVQGARPWLGF